jgi:hypothetical protein
MKGMQKRKNMMMAGGAPGADPRADVEITGFELQPMQVLMGSLGFVLAVILLHFWGKVVGSA